MFSIINFIICSGAFTSYWLLHKVGFSSNFSLISMIVAIMFMMLKRSYGLCSVVGLTALLLHDWDFSFTKVFQYTTVNITVLVAIINSSITFFSHRSNILKRIMRYVFVDLAKGHVLLICYGLCVTEVLFTCFIPTMNVRAVVSYYFLNALFEKTSKTNYSASKIIFFYHSLNRISSDIAIFASTANVTFFSFFNHTFNWLIYFTPVFVFNALVLPLLNNFLCDKVLGAEKHETLEALAYDEEEKQHSVEEKGLLNLKEVALLCIIFGSVVLIFLSSVLSIFIICAFWLVSFYFLIFILELNVMGLVEIVRKNYVIACFNVPACFVIKRFLSSQEVGFIVEKIVSFKYAAGAIATISSFLSVSLGMGLAVCASLLCSIRNLNFIEVFNMAANSFVIINKCGLLVLHSPFYRMISSKLCDRFKVVWRVFILNSIVFLYTSFIGILWLKVAIKLFG